MAPADEKAMAKPKKYTHMLLRTVEAELPTEIVEAMGKKGWNALGVYEVVAEQLKKERALERGLKALATIQRRLEKEEK